MFGIILASLGSLFEEVSGSIGKWELVRHRESLFTFAFLNLLWGGIFFAVIALVKEGSFVFLAASLPIFSIRALLEVFQVHVSVKALAESDRSTFSFVRLGTIPLLLLVDVALGYALGVRQIAGVAIILIGLLAVFMKREIGKRGVTLVALSTVNAVATISLYKYDITHFNSVVGEQLVMHALLLVYLFVFAYFFAKENPFRFLRERPFFAQSVLQGVGGVLESFAFSFWPASLIIAAKRSSAVFWSMLSGGLVFREKHLLLKVGIFLLLGVGIVLLVV
jgi:hypothetical protein